MRRGLWQEGTWVTGWGTLPPGALSSALAQAGDLPVLPSNLNLMFCRLFLIMILSPKTWRKDGGSKDCYRELIYR